jgi:hypothetical protein
MNAIARGAVGVLLRLALWALVLWWWLTRRREK